MHESKTNSTTRSCSSSSSNFKVSNINLPNNRVTSSAINDNNNNNNNSSDQRKAKKKLNRDKQTASNDDAKVASVMSNLSSYSLIDDDHIDDQETINVGNLIIDLESDLEKEKIENEQANNNSTESSSKPNLSTSVTIAPSSTSSTSSGSSKSNINNKLSLASNADSKNGVTKLGQRSNNKHPNSSSIGTSNSNNNVYPIINNGHLPPRTIFKSSADERGELKMKITRETKPGKLDHKLSANQKSSANNSAVSNVLSKQSNHENESIDNSDPTQSSISSTKECGTSTSVGTITEPDCLGPCEPGTSVSLEGIVWQETDGGILVVNVTWRGKTYVGALLDCTRHDWAPPRLCDSPASDIDLKTNKGVRTKRIVTRSNGNNSLDEKNLLQTTGKLRNGKGRKIPEPTPSCSKKQRDTSSIENAQTESNTLQTNTSSNNNSETASLPASVENANKQQESISTSDIQMDKAAPNSPLLIGCNEPNCSKKYRNMNGLLYHQSYAHGADNDSPSAQDEDCSSSTKDKIDGKPTKNEEPEDNQDTDAELVDRLSLEHVQPDDSQPIEDQQQTGQKRHRTLSPQPPSKMNKLANLNANLGAENVSTYVSEPSMAPCIKKVDNERRHSNSFGHGSKDTKSSEPDRQSPNVPQPRCSIDNQHNSSSSSGQHSTNKSNPSSSKQNNQLPPLPAPLEEGMKPSGTSTGPPPAPHQANCYFNPAFLANTFNPYAIPSYFPRIYEPMAPPTSNAAFFNRLMSNMRVPPPPPDSPSRMLSPSMPKNIPFSPFKVDPSVPPPPPMATSLGGHPIPNISSHMSNPQHPPPPHPANQVPPLPQGPPHPPHPPPPLGSGSPSLRMPSQGDPLLPPNPQPPFLPTSNLGSMFGIHGMPNPLGPIGGPQMPNLVDDALKQFQPRRFN